MVGQTDHGRLRHGFRRGVGAALAILALAFGPPSLAQTKAEPPVTLVVKGDEAPDKLQKLIENVRKSGREVQIRFADPPAAATPPAAAAAPAAAESGLFEQGVSLLRAGIRVGVTAVPAMPRLFGDLAAGWRAEAEKSGGWVALALLLLAIGGPLALAHAARAFTARLPISPEPPPGADLVTRFAAAGLRLVADAVGLVVLMATMHIAVEELLPAAGLTRDIAGAARGAIPQALSYFIVGRFLLAPGEPHRRLLPLPRAEWHYTILTAYGVFGAAILFLVALSSAVASDKTTVTGWFFVVGLPITALKIWWFWAARHDVRHLVLDTADDPARPSLLRRASALVLPGFLVASAVVIWIVGRMAAVLPDGAWWGWASGFTQVLFVLLPIAGPGAAALVHAARARRIDAAADTPAVRALWTVGQRAASGAVWLLGLMLIARMWAGALVGPDSADLIVTIRHLMTVAAVLVAGLIAWTFLKALFDAYTPRRASGMPGEDDEVEAGKAQSRLGTILPLLRGFVLGAVVGLTLLLALARLGLDIGPLLAGFGILGLALSFGSQALVRDIVSGIFFMAEDAFRVGEYIDTGKLKGTVEKISLRSVQLRHQSGQIHTVPYGQISSVTNASRDWATVKFAIRLDRAADIEKARKTIKKVGQDMLADPEVGPEFILPVKLQGVSDIQDSAIVVRIKFTAKPTRTSYLQRDALKRIYRALNEAGVPFASNAVTVRGADEPGAYGAAAAKAAAPPLAAVAG